MNSPSRLLAIPGPAAVFALLVTLGTQTLFATCAQAVAQDTQSVTVKYDDLNLTTDAGNKVLYARLRRAAETVCGDDKVRDLRIQAAVRECKRSAMARAVEQIGNERLAAIFAKLTAG